jgi:ribosomal protein S9
MIARKGVSNTMPSYSKLKVMKPLVHAGEKAALGDFDVELEVDSGGCDDGELKTLLLKV